MAYIYSTSARISARLGRAAFSTTTTPTEAQVETMENDSAGYVDGYCRATWQAAQSATETFNFRPTENYQDLIDGLPFKLRHRGIVTPLATASGDSLGTHEGGTGWTEHVGVWTEAANGQFWLDSDNGILFIRTNFYKRYVRGALRITYRHRLSSTVPGPIIEATTLLTALKVLEVDRYGMSLPSTGEHTVSPDQLNERWWKRAHELMEPYVEVQGVSTTLP